MPGQLLFIRLKTAERALRDGRMDEAHRLATAPDLRAHRRGAAVLAALAERFIDRARSHYRAERFTEALMDLERAEAGDVMQDKIAELRGQIQTVANEQHRQEQSRRNRLQAARQRVGDGSLEAGRRMLEQASAGDHAAKELLREIDGRAEDAAHLVEAAEKLISQGQMARAADRVRQAKKIDAHHEATVPTEAKLCNRVFENARSAMLKGRLGRAHDELACLGNLGDALPAKRELREVLAVARQAAQCVQAYQYAEARRHMMSLGRLLPKASWIGQTIKQLHQLTELNTELRGGPLAESALGDGHSMADRLSARPRQPAALDDTVAIQSPKVAKGSLPGRLLLLVDGGGSFLVLRGDQASVGRAASDNPADVAIFGDLAERHANLTRVDEDYFLFSTKEVEVAGRKTKHQLLRDGARMVFGRRAKLTFRLPSRKSLTAVLDLSDTTKMPNDVRRVVLLDRHATIGPNRNAHIYCRHAQMPLVLFERSGGLWIRPCGTVSESAENGGCEPVPQARPLRIGEPIEIAGASLVLEPWKISTPGKATL